MWQDLIHFFIAILGKSLSWWYSYNSTTSWQSQTFLERYTLTYRTEETQHRSHHMFLFIMVFIQSFLSFFSGVSSRLVYEKRERKKRNKNDINDTKKRYKDKKLLYYNILLKNRSFKFLFHSKFDRMSIVSVERVCLCVIILLVFFFCKRFMSDGRMCSFVCINVRRLQWARFGY